MRWWRRKRKKIFISPIRVPGVPAVLLAPAEQELDPVEASSLARPDVMQRRVWSVLVSFPDHREWFACSASSRDEALTLAEAWCKLRARTAAVLPRTLRSTGRHDFRDLLYRDPIETR